MCYYHPNHRGDTAFTTDETGNKRVELRYDAFGNTLYESTAEQVKYRFSGKEWDADAKLYYYGFRWYDPNTGIWTTKEPLGLLGGLNLYSMVCNDPISFVDVHGLAITTIHANMDNPDVIELLEDAGILDEFVQDNQCTKGALKALLKTFYDMLRIAATGGAAALADLTDAVLERLLTGEQNQALDGALLAKDAVTDGAGTAVKGLGKDIAKTAGDVTVDYLIDKAFSYPQDKKERK